MKNIHVKNNEKQNPTPTKIGNQKGIVFKLLEPAKETS
jgi:hypothetical protein